ncbi:hypothetical protein FACS189494_10570 [Spirochaetia bacterium]|nr:hypothetical protein FACS189494_10570 [Spirochaetia bacterium]
MKKLVFSLVIGLAVVGIASAQGWGGQWGNPGWASQSVTVSGTLQLQNGTIAVVNGNTVYYVPILERYIGFIEALKEGAQVSVDGFVSPNSNYLQATKLTVGGKSYDFTVNAPQGTPNNGYGRGGYGQGRGGWCCW